MSFESRYFAVKAPQTHSVIDTVILGLFEFTVTRLPHTIRGSYPFFVSQNTSGLFHAQGAAEPVDKELI